MAIKRTIALLILTLMAWSGDVHPAAVSEYQIKAAFLYSFAQFVDWPPIAPGEEDNAFKIGILGDDPFGADIDVIENKQVRGMPLQIVRAASLNELGDCRVIFLSADVRFRLRGILERLQERPVLTVSDTRGFAHQGVIINLITVDNKIRFQINPAAADRAGLKISSHLLRLADIVG